MRGFARPKPMSKSIRAPTGSKCAMGFSVNRPIIFAVPSPSR